MKKLLCLLLSVSMIATLFVATGVDAAEIGKVDAGYAPTGTAINSAADFAAMTATGSYYLNADITVDTTWNGGAALSATYASNTAFKGTLDGNGHTITTSVPLFANLAGTVKNLTIEGEIAGLTVGTTALNNAAVALYASGAFTLDNVCNKANVLSAPYSAGFVAFCATKGAIVSIKNCANYGNIYATTRNGGVIVLHSSPYRYARYFAQYYG